MSIYDSLSIIALAGVVKPSSHSHQRYVARWYSKTFHTPLHVVLEELPIEDVWLAFFEERFAALEEDELEEAILAALETPEQRKARLKEELSVEASDEEFARLTEEVAAKAAGAPNAEQAPIVPVVAEKPEPTVIMPDVEFEFVGAEDMERLLGKT